LRDVLREFDDAISEFERDRTVIFPSKGERLRLFFASQKTWTKRWSKLSQRMHPDCSNPSVGRSHAIPMGVVNQTDR
jgi:hypothetical protein